jgi:DNA-binding NtrC family response regulator
MPQESFTRAPALPPQDLPRHDLLAHEALPHDIAAIAAHSDPSEIVPYLIGSTVEAIERELVLQTLTRCDGNRTHAARMLGVSVRTLRNKIRQYAAEGLDVAAHG